MRRTTVMAVVAALAMVVGLAGARNAGAEGAPAAAAPIGSVVTVTGTVELGIGGAWLPAAAGQPLFEGQTIRTGAGAAVEVLFGTATPARLGEKTEIAVADLLLKAQLEATKAKITAPTDATRADMQVTPLTGVRGTEKSEEKAGEAKREHYWSEGQAPAAK